MLLIVILCVFCPPRLGFLSNMFPGVFQIKAEIDIDIMPFFDMLALSHMYSNYIY